jgi:predicted nucleotidyltransferase
MMKPVAETREARYNYERIFVKQGPPQGMTKEQFQQVSDRLRERLKQAADRTGDLGSDIFVHGSRGSGTAAVDADLDIGIRVSAERFDQLIQDKLARVKEGGDKWETLREALRQGRLHAGEAGISGIRKEIQRLINEEMNLGFAKGVQVTVIREAGPFDQGPFMPLRQSGN